MPARFRGPHRSIPSDGASGQFAVGGRAVACVTGGQWHGYEFVVVARTRQYVTVTDDYGGAFRVRIRRDSSGCEWAIPLGRPPKGPIVRPSPDVHGGPSP